MSCSTDFSIIIGAFLTAFVALVFLWNWRSTVIAAIAIPTSIVSTFALIYAMGFTLNIITLLALTLAVGIVIDDAIIVLENIYRFIEEKQMSPYEAAIEATKEIGLAVLATTLSLIAVFLPVAFMTGIVGRFLNSFGLTMAFAILVSLLVAFTLTPMLSARWLKRVVRPESKTDEKKEEARVGAFTRLENSYADLLRWSLAHRWVIVLISLGTLFTTVPLGKMVNKNFLPEDDQSQYMVSARARRHLADGNGAVDQPHRGRHPQAGGQTNLC